MAKFGFTGYKNAIRNYYKYKILNMDSLITLGTLAAFIMAIYLIIIYSLEERKNNMSSHLDGYQLYKLYLKIFFL